MSRIEMAYGVLHAAEMQQKETKKNNDDACAAYNTDKQAFEKTREAYIGTREVNEKAKQAHAEALLDYAKAINKKVAEIPQEKRTQEFLQQLKDAQSNPKIVELVILIYKNARAGLPMTTPVGAVAVHGNTMFLEEQRAALKKKTTQGPPKKKQKASSPGGSAGKGKNTKEEP